MRRDAAEHRDTSTGGLHPAGAGGGRRILVVEDEADIFACVEAALADEGYDVRWAEHGEAALAIIPAFRPEVIVLDLVMPVMDGESFLRVYRATAGPHAPVIVLTAASPGRARDAVIGAAAAIEKPFLVDDVLATIEACLSPITANRADTWCAA